MCLGTVATLGVSKCVLCLQRPEDATLAGLSKVAWGQFGQAGSHQLCLRPGSSAPPTARTHLVVAAAAAVAHCQSWVKLISLSDAPNQVVGW